MSDKNVSDRREELVEIFMELVATLCMGYLLVCAIILLWF